MPPTRQRAASVSGPHSVSVKVLRLSSPSLAPLHPALPSVPTHPDLQRASLAFPSQLPSPFPLTPQLTLPPAFGRAYVGERFACALSANNELPSGGVRDVRLTAELLAPSGAVVALPLVHANEDAAELGAGGTRQASVACELVEEGGHVLAVAVGYGEADGRARSFRKLYQFAAQQAVGVRTKVSEVRTGRVFVVEAQVENLTEENLRLEEMGLEVRDAERMRCRGLNGEGAVLVAPRDVEQVAFRVEVDDGKELEVENGRYVLAQMKVDWRMDMGQGGMLRTGWLGSVKRA